MKVGCTLPQSGALASPENLVRVAKRAEELGYDSVWVFERLLWPTNPRDPYPPSRDGSWPTSFQNVFDPIETLTFVAAQTRNVRLGTSALVLPYHQPIQLARRLATLDVLSEGRLEICGGVGWSRDEFEAVGAPFERRGARTDEMLEAMIAIWTRDFVKSAGTPTSTLPASARTPISMASNSVWMPPSISPHLKIMSTLDVIQEVRHSAIKHSSPFIPRVLRNQTVSRFILSI